MERRRLGSSDIEITPIGFGAWAIGGGDWIYGWGPQDDDHSIAAIHRAALDLGMNWIDTAAVYGLGHSEEVVARALADVPASKRPYVFTKCSLVWNGKRSGHPASPRSLRRELDGSLQRLGVETIDLYQIHWPSRTGRSGRPRCWRRRGARSTTCAERARSGTSASRTSRWSTCSALAAIAPVGQPPATRTRC